jgi:hypothetical protein
MAGQTEPKFDEILKRFADLGSGKERPLSPSIKRQGHHVWVETNTPGREESADEPKSADANTGESR